MALTSGTKLGPYEIQSPLGAGGMGEVYRATDTKLGRDVALKVLPAEMAHDPERLARFRREAKALAQLDHPNIVTIHSVEESDGVHFLTMQLVEGLPLDRLIPRGGLPVEQIVEIASALGDALAAAHEKGIVHRDLKPANVMVSNEGRVKVLDFGLAKDVRAINLGDATMTSASQTQLGVVMGTPAYMSPEQTSGRPLDHRTDIFSLGVMLHEMATGRRPFDGNSSAELVSAILRDTAPSVTEVRPDLPSDLARIIRRCLEKDPRHRVQTARDVSNEFRDLSRQTSQKLAPATTSTSGSLAAKDSGSARADEGFWVAVLPFKYAGNDADLTALAGGLTEDIVTGLSRFSYLRVIARGSTAKYSSESGDVRAIGRELGARYVMEGSLRRAGTRLRLAVQLVDTTSGVHLWAETFDRAFVAEDIFELQDNLVPRIVSTVAETHGVLPYSMSQTLRNRNPDELSPYEALLRGFAYFKHVNAEDHAGARAALEKAVQQSAGNADCWAMLSMLYREEYNHGFNVRADAVGRALAAARRAVDTAPSNHLAHHALASVLFFRRETQAFRSAAQRAMELNPMDGFTIAYMGFLISYSGDWERGCALMEKARDLNPNHPGWYWFPPFFNAYRTGDYRAALELALKVNMPGFWRNELALAATYGQLGELELARDAARELLSTRPDFAVVAREECRKWWDTDLVEQIIDGLRKAGLEIPDQDARRASAPSAATTGIKTTSGAARADEGFWVAVLPFKYAGASAELKALADGLSDEIVAGLSRFSYLRVIARGSTVKYSSDAGDIRAIGKELGARYVMDGNLRQAGTKLRLAVQLVDAVSGAHLWAENYERSFSPEDIFALQDDLVPRIVSTVADQYGVLPRSMSELLRHKSEDSLTPHEAVLRAFSYFTRLTLEEHATIRRILESAVREAPDQADCWAMLALMYIVEYSDGFNALPNPLERALAAAQRAVDAGPTRALGHYALAFVYFFRKEKAPFRAAVERTLVLNPMDGTLIGLLGLLMHHAGEEERGLQMVNTAMQLNPNYPGLLRFTAFTDAYCHGKYAEALEAAVRINMPGFFYAHAARAAALGQLGQHEAARQAVRDLLALRPDFGATMRQEYAKWYEPEQVEHFVDGLRKAGLEIADDPARSVPQPSVASAIGSGATRVDEGFWVAVLPFKYSGGNTELTALAEGLTEDIVTGLSRFSYLKVISRSSTSRYASQAVDVRAAGKELGARYVAEGSLRQAGTKVRVAVQLIDTTSGAHLWAENYERDFQTGEIFALQDDLVPRIVSTVADQYGILPRTMSEALRSKSGESLTPHEAVLRTFSYFTRITPEEHAAVGKILERAVREAPDHADSWAMLSMIYRGEFAQGFNAGPNPLDRALEAAQRAVDLAATHALGHYALATVYFFRKEMIPFRVEAERALALNPLDASARAYLGLLVAAAGEWDRGCQMVESAMQLNPNCPGYFYFARCCDGYRQGKYADVLEAVARINMPGYFQTHAMRAAALGQLGRREDARKALQDLLALRPDFAAAARQEYAKWYDSELIEQLIDGLRKAGLEIPDDPAKPGPAPVTTPSGAVRADESFWVAVLPFKYTGSNADLTALADGLTEDILTGLSRFSYLRVIARGSTARYAHESVDVRSAGKELGARYVMEGSLRQAGTKLRLAVQLVDAISGAHLWAENYERNFSPDTVFALQDELVPRIVSTVADAHGILPHTMSESIRGKSPDQLTPYEAVLRGFSYAERISPDEHAIARAGLERAVQLAPNYAYAWAMLSFVTTDEYQLGFNPKPDSLERALQAARRAVELDSSGHRGYQALALALFYRKEIQAFRTAAERALALNPMDGCNIAHLGSFIAYAGEWERGCALVEHALQLNPNHPGWFWFPLFFHAYRKGDYQGALKYALKINLPGLHSAHMVLAAAYGQLGQRDEASKAVQELLKLKPDIALIARPALGMRFDPETVEQVIDGLRKAGLEIDGASR